MGGVFSTLWRRQETPPHNRDDDSLPEGPPQEKYLGSEECSDLPHVPPHRARVPSPAPYDVRSRRRMPLSHPLIRDLVMELKAVHWHQLGLQLQVPRDKLEKIDKDYQSSERKLSEMLWYWLENDQKPSWDKICEALQRIGEFGRLVRELRMKYCSLKTCEQHYT